MFTKSQINALMLSRQTLEGLTITAMSAVSCVKYCLTKGVRFVMTERFNQDLVEPHFSIYRSSLGHNKNPTLKEFNNSKV